MAVLQYPEIVPDNVSWGWRDNTQTYESALNNAVQHASLPGGQWAGSLTYSNRDDMQDNIYAFKAFLMRLGGAAGRFAIVPPDINQRGSMAGVGVLSSTAAAGMTSISTGGWTPSQPTLFKAGDYIQIGDELKIVVQDAASNGSGAATLLFAPAMRKSVASGQAIVVDNPRCICYLEDDSQLQWQINTGPLIHAFSVAVVEDVT